ncbi:MAG: ornithine carbamoyltransferase [Gammaproteobacteria bacterium]|nr:MAG: ornithine carbamoyltransferase [Gammaproteobacteria bacterium]
MTTSIRHFLTLNDLKSDELRALLDRARDLKQMQHEGSPYTPLPGKVLAMVFEKSSTRTRVSFETAMAQFGGHAIFLSPRDTQLGRGEPIEDTARVLSGMVDAIMVRTYEHEKIERLAANSSVPVINGLTDLHHPCQLLADLMTYQSHRGDIAGRTVAWIGDGNNMCHSYIQAAGLLNFKLRIATPAGYAPDRNLLAGCTDNAEVVTSAEQAVRDAHLVVTDVWASMGQESEQSDRARAFAPYQINAKLMKHAAADSLFMHCLPAHRGEEVTAEVIDGPQSVVWDEAGNRLHSQKALLEFLLAGKS